ncbi:MAG: DUF6340 family protein [Dysgonomonas sp.]
MKRAFFDKVIPYDLPLRENASFLSEELLDSAKVVSILKETNTDALISLDRLILRSVYRSSNIGNSLISERIDVFVDTRFRFYSSDNVNLSIPVSFSDTVYGEAFRQGRYYLDDQKLPSRKEALRMAILHTADRMVYKFVPYWQDQERWYYTDANTRMREADVKASDNDWERSCHYLGRSLRN